MSNNAAAQVRAKLLNLFGEEKARVIESSLMREAGLTDLLTPQNRLTFGNALIAKGGVLEAVGRAIKIQALLQGASEPPSRHPSTG